MIRFATIGSGHIVEQFLTEAKKHPEFTLTAVYSRTGERAAEFAARWEAPLTFTDRQARPVRKAHGHHLHRLRRHGAAGAQ